MHKRKKKHRICVGCGEQITTTQFHKPVEDTRCRSCACKIREKNRDTFGTKAHNWKGGVSKRSDGYALMYCKDHPRSVKNYIRWAYFVWEQNTGHFPDIGEVIHHIDGDKTNDEFSNLQLMTHGEHSRLHMSGKNNHNYKHGRYAKKK